MGSYSVFLLESEEQLFQLRGRFDVSKRDVYPWTILIRLSLEAPADLVLVFLLETPWHHSQRPVSQEQSRDDVARRVRSRWIPIKFVYPKASGRPEAQ